MRFIIQAVPQPQARGIVDQLVEAGFQRFPAHLPADASEGQFAVAGNLDLHEGATVTFETYCLNVATSICELLSRG